jgi:hypothetical protein
MGGLLTISVLLALLAPSRYAANPSRNSVIGAHPG